ncbi:flagellar hook-basal body complex protein FliE [Pelagerythrobacter rhizovicinus]|uniref:Flagellar hook-basal body complex protein FliE n=1 Tax=Pelagerythrobacter rhizovicinus TaxID=2268576 RepID=A0A4Q2KP10_9SPHN|nr:flagellar hook-basal body complex protein FliE [Pelagerythrobacter rhizovicinus]RXZ65243.1 flagellar hook-basal body complex protein FliE [Pelagerythrobacter rhizovicinus]
MSGVGGIGGAGSVQQIMALRQQIVERSSVLQEIHQAKGAEHAGAAAPSEPAGGGFADTLRTALDGVNAAQTKSSELAAGYERGEVTDIAKVMLARQEAGIAFEATLQVRNKLLSAYQDIMRMGV